MKAYVLAALALTSIAGPAAAQSLKPGLWEIQQKMPGNPEMDKAMAEAAQQMAAMPPAQRKQMEAMMAQRGMQMAPGAGGGMAVRMCMTREMAERNEVASQDDCKTTQQQRTGNTMKVAFTCTNPPSTGESQVTFNGSEAYTSRTTVSTTTKGKTEKTTIESTGKFLGADCGSVKPPAAAGAKK